MTVVRGFLKAWGRVASWFYFRDLRVVFHGEIPRDEPVIFAGNHRNSFLDALILIYFCKRQPFALTRASVFKWALARFFLKIFGCIPIHRFRDGFQKLRNNPGVLDQCVRILGNKGALVMFPEGTHDLRHTLRPLQKGVARIAFSTLAESRWERDVSIIPVGLQYESVKAFGGRLLVRFGHPISSREYRNQYEANAREAETALTEKVSRELEKLLIVLPPAEEAYEASLLEWKEQRTVHKDLMEQFEADRRIVAGGSAAGGPRGEGSPWRRLVGYTLIIPGFILHLPVIAFTRWFLKKWVTDPHYTSSMRFVCGMFLVPVWYVAVLFLRHSQVGIQPWDWGLLFLMPLSFWIMNRFWHWIT